MKTMSIRLRLPFGPLLFSAALLASLSVGFVGVHSLADSREAAVHLAEVRSRNLVNSADQNITAMLHRIDHTLLSVAGAIERDLETGGLDPARMAHILAFEEQNLPEAVAIRVTNSEGTVILNNSSDRLGASVADRPFFPFLKEHPEAGLFVTKPLQGLFTRAWAIPCVRRYNLPDGRFGGVIVAPVLLGHFEQALGGYDVGPGGLRTLRDSDGGFVTRYPTVVKGRTITVGDTSISNELQALLRSGVSQETFFSLTPYDQTRRTFTFRRMQAAPLIVEAGLAEEDYLAQWYKDRARTLAVVVAFIAGTWIMAGLLWRSWKGQESDAEALMASETKYRNLVETAQELVWKCDVQGRFTYLNPAWEKTHGYKIAEMLGRGFGEFQRPEVFARDRQEFARELAGGSVKEYETTHIARDGRELTLLFNVVPEVNARGEVIGTQGTAIDITERKRADEERLARVAAEEANRAKSVFVANMSHEIRTPLNAILGFAQVLERDPLLTTSQAKSVQTISRSGAHLLRVINDILDMSRIEAGLTALNEAAFCLYDLLDDLEMVFNSRAEAKGLQLLMERDESVPRYVTADESKLRQVLVNLLGNAVKLTETGGVAVRVRVRRDAEKGGQDPESLHLEVEVEDSGPGISAADIDRIFAPFQQAEAGAKAGGTGLGLTISRNFVELMGGELTVASQVGKGSCFRFEVLLKPAADVTEQEKPTRRRVVGLEPGAGPYRILVVDDTEFNRLLICELLRPVGFEVAEANNGAEALEVYERWSPQAVLMDMRMPVMDGYEATRRLKATEKGRATPVIAVTASAFEEQEAQIRAAGVTFYLRKPFRCDELFEVLGRALGLRYLYAEERDGATAHSQSPPLTAESGGARA